MKNKDVLPNLFATVPEVAYRIVGPSLNPYKFNEMYATQMDYANLTLNPVSDPEGSDDAGMNFIHEDSRVTAETIIGRN